MTKGSLLGPPESPPIVDGFGFSTIADWVAANQDWESILHTHGSLLFRGFDIPDPETCDKSLDALMQPTLEFPEETSPRSGVSARIFTSTDYPQDYPIQFHHEFSYRREYPERLAFCCMRPATAGGATPLADARRVLRRLPDALARKFERLGISYIRNFTGLGVSWQDAFSTNDKESVSAYCDSRGIECNWSGESLYMRQTRPAIVAHPVTGERAWFNSVLNLNVAGVEPEAIRQAMMMLPPDSVPSNTTYGSGDPIEPETLETIRQAYAEEAVRFSWQSGDLLLIDNILTAHARDPFTGDRHIIVGMGSDLRHGLRSPARAVRFVLNGASRRAGR
jgi:alpha-ketoglutarate-dependent taurine dioxygenase